MSLPFLVGADGAYFPTPPSPPDVILGYVGLPSRGGAFGPTRIWTEQDWTRAKATAPYLVPIVVPDTGWASDPVGAAQAARDACIALGIPAGTLLVLDREENRGDLTAEWCDTFRVELGRFTLPSDWHYLACGYTSAATMNVFDGWTYRWAAHLTTTEPDSLDGYTMVQWKFGDGYDLSIIDPAVTPFLWFPHDPHAAPPTPPPTPAPAPKEPLVNVFSPFVAVATGKPSAPRHRGEARIVRLNAFIVWPNGTRTYVAEATDLAPLLAIFGQQSYTYLSCQTLANIPPAS